MTQHLMQVKTDEPAITGTKPELIRRAGLRTAQIYSEIYRGLDAELGDARQGITMQLAQMVLPALAAAGYLLQDD